MVKPRGGFALIELLVVIAIVGVLGALILPAVQSAREAARRTRCANNLRQVGLGLAAYHEALGSLPMGLVASPSGQPYATSPGWGWAALVLPQLEQRPLYDASNFSLPVESAANLTTRTARLSAYICPSDADAGLFDVAGAGGWGDLGEFATNSYAACFGAGGDVGEAPGRGNGLFSLNRVVRYAQVRDGMGTTIAVGERGACLVRTPWTGAPQGGVSRIDGDSGDDWGHDTLGRGAELVLAHADAVPPNAPGTGTSDFYSPHGDVVNFLFADGSVRPIRSTIDLILYRALCTRSGGEVVDADAD
jgi:prepilin-type N-terminal cleavage/methylation domain-containing protein/prepilin-type processing-associated H-X9-DG protein